MRRFAIAFLFVSSATARAEINRYELGQRLRLMDRAWETATPENRAKAVVPLKKVVPFFFANKNAEAAAVLDEARFILKGIAQPTAAQRWATALAVSPRTRLCNPADEPLTIRVTLCYPTNVETPATAKLMLSATIQGKKQVLANEAITTLPALIWARSNQLPAGDHAIDAAISVDGQTLAETRLTLSIIPLPRIRLAALDSAIRSLPEAKTLSRQTARMLNTTIGALSQRSELETDYPAHRLLAEAEELVDAAAAGKALYGVGRPGEFWLSIPASAGDVAVRLFVPAGLSTDHPKPLVVAMHGLGASENMFFDAYGDGAAVKMCKERGWLLVATRAGGLLDPTPPVGRIVDELAKLYPVDPKRVYILGHSMGATQTIATVQAHPGKFAAAAALGGGGLVRKPEAVKDLPVFVACGAEDFALSGAKVLTKALENAGARVTFREYPDVEHIVIVQAAMKEMFAFFEHSTR